MNPWDIFSWVAAACLALVVIAIAFGIVVAMIRTAIKPAGRQ